MYKIIGADGLQYGPVSADQLREWISAGRANGQSMVSLEGSVEWKPLSLVPEFAGSLASAVSPPLIQALDVRKSKLVAGLLGILVGGLGVHRFYLGYIGLGIAQIAVTLLTCGVGHLWGLIEGILILVGSGITTDSEGRPLKDQ